MANRTSIDRYIGTVAKLEPRAQRILFPTCRRGSIDAIPIFVHPKIETGGEGVVVQSVIEEMNITGLEDKQIFRRARR